MPGEALRGEVPLRAEGARAPRVKDLHDGEGTGFTNAAGEAR